MILVVDGSGRFAETDPARGQERNVEDRIETLSSAVSGP